MAFTPYLVAGLRGGCAAQGGSCVPRGGIIENEWETLYFRHSWCERSLALLRHKTHVGRRELRLRTDSTLAAYDAVETCGSHTIILA